MPGFGDVFGRSAGRQARIETPALGFGNPSASALNSAMHEAGRQAHPRRSGPRPPAQYEHQDAYPDAYRDGYQDPRYRQI